MTEFKNVNTYVKSSTKFNKGDIKYLQEWLNVNGLNAYNLQDVSLSAFRKWLNAPVNYCTQLFVENGNCYCLGYTLFGVERYLHDLKISEIPNDKIQIMHKKLQMLFQILEQEKANSIGDIEYVVYSFSNGGFYSIGAHKKIGNSESGMRYGVKKGNIIIDIETNEKKLASGTHLVIHETHKSPPKHIAPALMDTAIAILTKK